jgi:hypothetical protein
MKVTYKTDFNDEYLSVAQRARSIPKHNVQIDVRKPLVRVGAFDRHGGVSDLLLA